MNAITEFESDKCLLSFIAMLFITAQLESNIIIRKKEPSCAAQKADTL